MLLKKNLGVGKSTVLSKTFYGKLGVRAREDAFNASNSLVVRGTLFPLGGI